MATVDSATQFTISGALWQLDQLTNAASPHLAKIMSGALVGRTFLITGHTTSQITVSLSHTPSLSDLRPALQQGDRIDILPAKTLGNVFGTDTPLLTTGPSASAADNVFLLNGPGLGWSTYYHNGSNWKKAGALGAHDNTILYPDEGILVVHIGTAPVTLYCTGVTPSTTERTDLSGTGSTFVAHRFPVDEQLGAIGFQATTGWISATTASAADNVWAWNVVQNKWDQFYYNGSNWRKAGSIANQNTTVIPAGAAVIVIRAGTTTTAILNQTPPYVP